VERRGVGEGEGGGRGRSVKVIRRELGGRGWGEETTVYSPSNPISLSTAVEGPVWRAFEEHAKQWLGRRAATPNRVIETTKELKPKRNQIKRKAGENLS